MTTSSRRASRSTRRTDRPLTGRAGRARHRVEPFSVLLRLPPEIARPLP
jgi:hypothetical protein